MSAVQENLPAISKPLERLIVHDPVGILDSSRFEHMMRIAKVMACSSLIPDSLTIKDKRPLEPDAVLGNCFLVVNQASRWNADPFAVAQCVSIVKGKICYEGKLISAIIAAKLGVRLSYEWNDKPGDAFGIVVSGTIPGETDSRSIAGTVGQWRTDNEQWKKNPRNMLAYRGSREWGRLYASDIMLGVYSPDELEDLTDNMRATRANDVTRKEPPAIPREEPERFVDRGMIEDRGAIKSEPESFQDELTQLELLHAAEDDAKAKAHGRKLAAMEAERRAAKDAKQPEDEAEVMDAAERGKRFAKMREEEAARVANALAEQKRTAAAIKAGNDAEAAIQAKRRKEDERREAEEEAALAAVEASKRAIEAEEAAAAKRTPPNPDDGLELTDELMADLTAKAQAREAPNPALKALIEEGTAHAENGRKAHDGLDRWYSGLCVKDLDIINPHMRQLIDVAKKADRRAL
jgi:hypothetical protein